VKKVKHFIYAKASTEDSRDAIESAMKELNDYSSPIAHKMLDININEALKGQKI
jgi:hypothetical protein